MSFDNVHKLLAKEVDRKEFIAHIGATALAVIGVGGLIKAFTNPKGTTPYHASSQTFTARPRTTHTQPKVARATGYGSSTYGGKT
jgi:hypothetical protein